MPKLNNSALVLLSLAALSLGCSGSAHSTGSRRDYYAQSTCMDSETCCLQRNAGDPAACGLDASEAAVLMGGAKAAADAAQAWDDSHNAGLPEWKRECIRAYGDCKTQGWKGDCYSCFQYCEGQHEWPINKCRPQKKGD